MNSTRAARARDIFLLSGGLLLFAYFIARAFAVSFIADEAGTWQMFVSKGEIFPAEYGYFGANNHALNTALMMLFEKLFGTSAFVLRLPNVLAGGLYLFSTAMMVRRFPSPLIAVLAFVVLNTNPFMIQYFNVARGYGLAAGLMAFAFWQLWKYFDDGAALKNLLAALIASSLAVFANYNYVNVFLPLIGFTGLFILFHRGENKLSTKARIVHAGIVAVVAAGIVSAVYIIGNKIKAGGGFWPSSYEFFWSESMVSVMDGILFDVGARDPEFIMKFVILAAEIYFVASIVVLGRAYIMRKETERNYFPLFVFFTLTLSGLSVVMQHILLDIEYPVQRIGLFLVWPLLLLISLAAGMSKRNNVFAVAPFALLTAFLLWHFVSTVNSWREAFHPASEQVNQTIEYLQERTPEGERVRILVDPVIMSCGFDFYATTLPLPEFDVKADTAFDSPLYRYCFVSRDNVSKVPREYWQTLRGFANGNVLFENTSPVRSPVAEHVINDVADSVTVISEWNPFAPTAGTWLDSVPGTSDFLVHVEMEIWREKDSRAATWITVHRGEQELYAYIININAYPADGQWHKLDADVVLPSLQYGDVIIAPTYWGSGSATQIKNFTLTVKAY